MKRGHISLRTKLASALLALGDVPYNDAKLMTAEMIISLYNFDHGVLHSIDPIDEPWNLTPRLIAPHREKSKADTATVAKVKRIERKQQAHMRTMGGEPAPLTKPLSRIKSRGFQKGPKKPWAKRKFGKQ